MSVEIRPVRSDEEWAQHSFIAAYAFNGDRSEEAVQRRAAYCDREWTLAAFEGPEMVAGLVVIPFEQYINGGRVPLGGVASVSCLPEHRRRGHVRALLRHALASMRDARQALSGLYTPHHSLYRRFGWEVAARSIFYSFEPKLAATRLPAGAGRWRRATDDDWPLFDALYSQFHAHRNGALTRDERRWRYSVLRDGPRVLDAALWSDAQGEPRGYVVYGMQHRQAGGSPFGETVLRVYDWVALDGEAYGAVLRYLLTHDLVTRIVLPASQDEPLPDAFTEPEHVGAPPGAWLGLMLRLVDVQRALELRPALPHASGKSVTVALTDETAPWNAGTWRIECSEGRISAERTSTPAGLEMDVRALAPLYNGYTKPADAVRVGTVRAASADAVAAATDIFATSYSPYCPEDF